MAIRTEPQLEAQIATLRQQIATLLPDNSSKQISALDVRTVLSSALNTIMDLVDSVSYTASIMAGGLNATQVNALIATAFTDAVTNNTETLITVEYVSGKLNFVADVQAGGGGGGLSTAQVNALIAAALTDAVSSNTETGITVEYTNGKLNFVVPATGITLAQAIAAVLVDTGAAEGVQLTRTATGATVTIGLQAEPLADHTRFFGWSTDRSINVADFAAASQSQTDSSTFPTRAGDVLAYLWFAVPEGVGWPDHLHFDGQQDDHLSSFEQLSGTVDDQLGVPHIIGITYFSQLPAAYSGVSVDLLYN